MPRGEVKGKSPEETVWGGLQAHLTKVSSDFFAQYVS
jgi:hypothetical protein